MATRFVSIDRDTPLLLAPNLRDWVPGDHLVHFILDAVEVLDMRQVKVNTRGTGSEQYPADLMLGLLIYSYATGTFSSRRIEQSTHESIPEEITRREQRKAALAQARAEIEARAHARYALQLQEHEEKLAERAAKKQRGEKVRGRVPKAPTDQPNQGDQYNITDPESRIMKAANGNHFEQSYNAQAAVEVESRLIVGQRVSQACNDKQELIPTLASIPAEAGTVAVALVDSGFFSQKAVLGFREFRLRGREKVSLEWTLVCLAYNLKRLHRMGVKLKMA